MVQSASPHNSLLQWELNVNTVSKSASSSKSLDTWYSVPAAIFEMPQRVSFISWVEGEHKSYFCISKIPSLIAISTKCDYSEARHSLTHLWAGAQISVSFCFISSMSSLKSGVPILAVISLWSLRIILIVLSPLCTRWWFFVQIQASATLNTV